MNFTHNNTKKRVAISIGDLNGIGIELALQNHAVVRQIVHPTYCIDQIMLEQISKKLATPIPKDFKTLNKIAPFFKVTPSIVSKDSGRYAYSSFYKAVEMAKEKEVDAICTLPIHKKAWELAGINYKGHTDALRDFFDAKAIMMLGCPKMYVALFTEHIPLKEVSKKINQTDLEEFFMNFYKATKPNSTIAVLGLNPHAGDDGVLGNEEKIIQNAINNVNKNINASYPTNKNIPAFSNPIVPDIAFTSNIRKKYTHYVAMYHDQGLAPLKALYFDEGINVSLNLPIMRTSVDHGTAFDVAYKGVKLNNLSYINAIKYIAESDI